MQKTFLHSKEIRSQRNAIENCEKTIAHIVTVSLYSFEYDTKFCRLLLIFFKGNLGIMMRL
jgi:hypothetical protein